MQPLQNANNLQTTANNLQTNTISNRQVLNGKTVDSIDVVKATDIPLDGSISYFPLMDGTAIVTKQLKQDGTSQITVYRPVEEKTAPKVEYATIEDIKKSIKEVDVSDTIEDLKDEIKDIKTQIKKIKKGDQL